MLTHEGEEALATNDVTRTLRRQPLAIAGLLLLALFVGCALFAPLLASADPAALDLNARLASPSHLHWFGTEELGRDIFSRVVYGSRISLLVAISVVSCSLFLGLFVGGLAGD